MRRIAVLFVAAAAATACTKSEPAIAPGSEAPKPAPVVQAEPAATPTPAPADAAAPAADPWGGAPKQVAKDPLPHPLFWSVEKNGKTTYLLGTMHMGVDAEARLPQIVWDKFDAAPVLAVETDISDPSILGMGQRASGTLHDDLGPAYWKKLEALIDARILQGLDKMKPAMTVAFLSMRGLPQTAPMDGVLLARAQGQHKELAYLEPAIKQAKLLEKWLDLRALKTILDAPEKGLEESKQMLAAYVAGDEAKILALADAQKKDQLAHGISEAEYKQSMKEMLYDRNASWIGAIEKIHARGGGFIAVGALHLVGKHSVLDLLAKRGYKVTRIAP